MRGLDFSSWQAVLTSLLALSLVTLVMIGVRLLVVQTIQERRQRENRQINERLRILIAAYKVLGGSFTGDLQVDPTHRRELRNAGAEEPPGAERRRQVRDAVEAALSDVLLLGTEQQVVLAARAAQDLVAGRPVETSALVVSLRDFIRGVLDLEPVPSDVDLPRQGPTRPSAGSGRGGRGDGGRGEAGGRGGGGSGGSSPLGVGAGLGGGLGVGADDRDLDPSS